MMNRIIGTVLLSQVNYLDLVRCLVSNGYKVEIENNNPFSPMDKVRVRIFGGSEDGDK